MTSTQMYRMIERLDATLDEYEDIGPVVEPYLKTIELLTAAICGRENIADGLTGYISMSVGRS